ncbi:aldo/keto reductase [Nocardia sp. BMG111209]|uniref:aldo/keto reductase n=1 Tax=Nocardia sp. BMG111209 TaxID=1160137 RepID=UPI001E3594EA|nr:aldo/keto reductase [Nocardia sp. BMG111209]
MTYSLGDTGMDISALGFGTWVIAGSGWQYSWGATEDEASIAAIRHAVDRGLNWIDTAPAYGVGHAESLVGRALSGIPESERPFVFTKTGLVWEDGDDLLGPPRRIMRPEAIRRDLEQSLRRLRIDHIDLYQVHWPDTGAAFGSEAPGTGSTPLEEYWQVMADLREQGVVRAIGLSNHDVGQLDRAEAVAHVDVIQPPFSAVNRTAADEIAWAAKHSTGVIVYSSLQSGLLTGAFAADRVLGADDWRSGHPDFTTGLAANLALVEAFRPIARRHEVSVAEVALAWTVAWPGVTGAIVGARTPEQIDGWAGAGELRLDEGDLADIAAAIVATGAGAGPARP